MKNSHSTADRLLVWDSEELPPVMVDCTLMLWRRFTDDLSLGEVSIPKLIEEQAESLKTSYLSWIYELGELRFRDRRVVDHLEIQPGFSYWWMTRLVEKCNYSKSPQITDAFRLLAFKNWANGRTFKSVKLLSADTRMAKCIRIWCAGSGVRFEWQRLSRKRAEPKTFFRRFYRRLPYSIQAVSSLASYLIDRWPLRGSGLKNWKETTGQITFISYFFNLVPEALKNGTFQSGYWAHLPDELQREGCQTNWLHVYVKDGLVPTARYASGVIQQFNRSGIGRQIHVTLDSFLSVRVILLVLYYGLRLSFLGRVLRTTLSSSKADALDFWPLFDEEWLYDLCGPAAMMNLLYFNLFQEAFTALPGQQLGYYLQENQGWEAGLVHAWKKSGHGLLTGVPHSTVRYWDLRYFFDPRGYRRTGKNDLPLPDKVALNGAAAMDKYQKGGYPAADCIEVEALRYTYIQGFSAKSPRSPDAPKSVLNVLVLGEYLHGNTRKQMRLLEQALPLLQEDVTITVKPHPACPILSADYPGISMRVTMEPISQLLAECDVAYSSAVTSAAVDAYCAGVPIVSVLDPDVLNLSPLRGCSGVLFASTPQALANALMQAVTVPQLESDQDGFFIFDTRLPRWRKLLLNVRHYADVKSFSKIP